MFFRAFTTAEINRTRFRLYRNRRPVSDSGTKPVLPHYPLFSPSPNRSFSAPRNSLPSFPPRLKVLTGLAVRETTTMAAVATARGAWARLLSFLSTGGVATLRLSRNICTVAGATGTVPCRPHGSASSIGAFFFFPRNVSSITIAQRDRAIRDLLAEVEREKQRERDEKKRAGVAVEEEDEEEDFMGVGPLIDKWEKRMAKETVDDEAWDIPSDSDSDDDERFSPQEVQRRVEEFEKKHKRHEELLLKFAEAETLDEARKCLTKIDKFEEKFLKLPLEYIVIGDLMNRLKHATEKEKFILQQKLNRAVRLMDCKEAYDPNNPANYGVIRHSQVGPSVDQLKYTDFGKERKMIQGDLDEDENEDFNEAKENDEKLTEKLNAIDKKLEEKLAELGHTFGKKGRILEQEIKELADERTALTEKSKRPFYRKGFEVKVINVNRTCKVTKGGQLTRYTSLLACGNFNGVIGFAKAKGPTPRIAIQKAYEKCFQNLHYVERHEEHTIAHAVQTKYEKTKIYLWPAPTRSGVVGSTKTVVTILYLAGFKNVKSKVIGSRNPHNTVKALFKALNAIETPKDVQEKFGRTVVESYLL